MSQILTGGFKTLFLQAVNISLNLTSSAEDSSERKFDGASFESGRSCSQSLVCDGTQRLDPALQFRRFQKIRN